MTFFDQKAVDEAKKPEEPTEDNEPRVNVEAINIAETFQGLLSYAGKVAELQAYGWTKEQIATALASEPEPLIEALHFGVMCYGIIGLMKTKIQQLQKQLEEVSAEARGGSMLKLAKGLAAKGIDVEAVKKAEAENEAFEAARKAEQEG